MDTFKFLVRNLKIKSYEELINVKREEIEKPLILKNTELFLKKKTKTRVIVQNRLRVKPRFNKIG